LNEQQVVAIVKVLQSAYPRTEFSRETITVYENMLKDLPAKETSEAVKRLITSSKWLPTIAEIRQEVAELMTALPDAEEAWIEVQDYARHGWCPTAPQLAQWSNPVIGKAVEAMGGIATIAQSDQGEWLGREFRRVYERLREKQIRNAQIQALPGSTAIRDTARALMDHWRYDADSVLKEIAIAGN